MAKVTFKSWLSAARPRTLPLSISGIIVGSALGLEHTAASEFIFESSIFWLAIATTLGLQVLSNFANDYGDGLKGTDNDERIGPKRAIQSGSISQRQMLRGMIVTAIITLGFAIMLIYQAFEKDNFGYSLIFFGLGIISIIAAVKYTVGKSAYGYRGFGDVFVFVFFGLVSTVGCYFLFTKNSSAVVFLPALTIGCLSTAVLNLNNMRDINSDRNAGKNTLVVKMGWKKAKIYHQILGYVAFLGFAIYTILRFESLWNLLPILTFIILGVHFRKVWQTENPSDLDPELKKVALSTFVFAVLMAISTALS